LLLFDGSIMFYISIGMVLVLLVVEVRFPVGEFRYCTHG
jgi:hypothetical protein